MGVYPLLQDDTCWFLAADFNKAAWREDVRAFARTARALGLPCAEERSQSGHGARNRQGFLSLLRLLLCQSGEQIDYSQLPTPRKARIHGLPNLAYGVSGASEVLA